MKKILSALSTVLFFCSSCLSMAGTDPAGTGTPILSAPAIPFVTRANPTASPVHTATPQATLPPPTPTFINAPLPQKLQVAYITDGALWLWKDNASHLLLERPLIYEPQISGDGQWIAFQQRHQNPDGSFASIEVWAIRADGSELHRLLSSDELTALAEGKDSLRIDQIAWLPGSQELLFNTEKRIEGPPEIWPMFDLFRLDLSGQLSRLAEPGLGGKFIPSPDSRYVAVVSDRRIGVIDLQTGERRTLLEFQPLAMGCECYSTPQVVWDPQSQFVLTAIPPRNLHYPEQYAGEREKVWRLFVRGQAELVMQWKPLAQGSGFTVDPNLHYFLFMKNSCSDAMGMLTVYDLETGTETPLFCVWDLPRWMPDGEHFLYNWDFTWRLGKVFDSNAYGPPLAVLNLPYDPNAQVSPQVTWINETYFLLRLRSHSQDFCTVSVATLEGVVAEIIRTSFDVCPWVDFSISQW